MPNMRKDQYSGAIIFDLTPEEQATVETRQELEQMKTELDKKLKLLDDKLSALDDMISLSSKSKK